MAKFITSDGHLVASGTLIYYVNYLGKVTPVIFQKKTKTTVVYFAELDNANQYVKEGKHKSLQ